MIRRRLNVFYCDSDGDIHHLCQRPAGWQHHYLKFFLAQTPPSRDGRLLLRQDSGKKRAELFYVSQKRSVMRLQATEYRPAKWSDVLSLHHECSGVAMPAQKLVRLTANGVCYEGSDGTNHRLETHGLFNNWKWLGSEKEQFRSGGCKSLI